MMQPRCLPRGWQNLKHWMPAAALAVALIAAGERQAQAQKKKPDTELKVGKLVSLEKEKGRNLLLKMKDDTNDSDLEFQLTPRVPLVIKAKGDDGFFRPKAVVQGKAVLVGENLFTRKVTVYLGTNLPSPQVMQDPNAKDLYEVTGQVQGFEADKLTVNFGPSGGVKELNLEAGYSVEVQSNDPQVAKPGATVEVEGIARGKTFNLQKVTVTVEEPLKGDEVFADDKDEKPGAKGKAAKPAPKGKTDAADKAADPFAGTEKKKPTVAEKKKLSTNDPFSGVDKKKPAANASDKKLAPNDPFGSVDKKKPAGEKGE